MILFEEALAKILDVVETMPPVSVPIDRINGHVLAEAVTAPFDSPPFDNSAVDGFGVRVADVASASESAPSVLPLSGTIRAGDDPSLDMPVGSALKILTGAGVPSIAEGVVMREYCHEENGSVRITRPISQGENIRRKGSEFITGQNVLHPGVLVSPPVTALLANLGYGSFPVFGKPKAAVITTGNELTPPGEALLPGRIYDSNSYGMKAVLNAAGVEDCIMLHASEDEEGTRETFSKALQYADIVLSTGGVSVGDYDYVKPALEALGVETHVWRIAIKPGKPVYFGLFHDKTVGRTKYVFGLPGNPVSAFVTYHQLVKPALAKLMGLTNCDSPKLFKAKLLSDLKKRAGRAEFVRARLKFQLDGSLAVQPTTGQDSHMLGGLATADVLIHFPLEAEHLPAGIPVLVQPLVWELST